MLTALFENTDILIVDKPSGLPVQGGEGVGITIIDAIERDFGFKPFLVHRLDKETSGCLLVARSSRAAAEYGRIFQLHSCVKRYHAIVAGSPESDSFSIDDDVVVRGVALKAETNVSVLKRFSGFSLLELALGTGRTHQIRLHLAGRGFPIVADDRHGDFKLNKLLAKELGARRLMLYACRLMLPEGIDVSAAEPAHFSAFLKTLSIEALP